MTTAMTAQGGTSVSLGNSDVSGHVSSACRRVAPVLARVGDKWTILVVMQLGEGPVRFNELRRRIGGISQRMLTFTLRGLERDGFVRRTVYPTVPPRVDYELTELGRSLRGPVRGLGEWAQRHLDAIEAAQRRFDAAAPVVPNRAAS
ncbi:MAG: helix-turn-helix domain-containing protein [Xanthobacteraceae bacterium]